MSDLLSFLLISFLLLFSSCWPFILLFWERASTLSSSPYIAVLFLPSSYLSFLVFSLSLVFFFITSCFCFMKAVILKTISLCCSFARLCLTLCKPMDCSMPGFPVLQYLPQFAQTHVHCISDAIQPSHPLVPFSSCLQSFPASGSFLMSQFFPSGDQSIGASASAAVLPVNIQDWFPWGLTGLISLLSKGLARVFFSTPVQKHQFFGTQLSL